MTWACLVAPLCTFYAYCLMSNHVHLLIKTHQEDIGATIKHLAVMYALYFNRKYSRAGHLFQDRFKSEPVRSSSARLLPARLCRLARPRTGRKNDMAYFTVLLRYIHQNPVKAGLVERIGDYQWSSWGEYTGDVPKALGLCATNVVLKRMPLEDLRGLVEDPLADDVCILDIDDTPRITIGDRDVRHLLETAYGISDAIKVQELDKDKRNDILLACLSLGAGYRQLSRLTGVPYGVIHRLNSKMNKK